MSPSVEMPIVGSVWGEFCLEGLTPVMELLGYKAGIEEIIAGVEVGVGDFQKDLKKSIPIPGIIKGEQKFGECGQNPPVNPPPPTRAPPPTPDKPTTTPDKPTTTPDKPTTIPDAQTTTPEAPTTTPDEPCTIELVFLLDGSWSIGPINFEEMKEYIRDVIACLDSTNTKVSVIRYDEKPMTYITLGGYTSITHLQYLIMYVSFQGSLTKTGHAIRYMATVVPFDSSVHKAAVVVTDGRSQADVHGKKQDGYAESASEARNAGIELFCIAAGIDVFINYDELNIITDNPARVVYWKQMDPCEFAVLLLTELCG
ncbi:PREDICTED: collagen alpha-1(XIV) chain-like [Branchiostoma belcheri]|uniref:Collagen alpha-1(XIV) chain-like n=1 Tax=Branchiostoma belcheri TaxID=7741 RepID=A0A6P4ZVT6_BRABE|nr:PREDICTED: collagen alpha-1(XIV) chain-like [Branchiostoma belcheri]